MFLNNQWVKEEIKNFLEKNENENTTLQNLGDATKTGVRGKFLVIYTYLKKQDKFQINNPILYLRKTWKREINKTQSNQKGNNKYQIRS